MADLREVIGGAASTVLSVLRTRNASLTVHRIAQGTDGKPGTHTQSTYPVVLTFVDRSEPVAIGNGEIVECNGTIRTANNAVLSRLGDPTMLTFFVKGKEYEIIRHSLGFSGKVASIDVRRKR